MLIQRTPRSAWLLIAFGVSGAPLASVACSSAEVVSPVSIDAGSYDAAPDADAADAADGQEGGLSVPVVVQIASGGNHSCAVFSDGAVRCWGSNGYGEVGSGSFIDVPKGRRVDGLAESVEVAAGVEHSCARTNAGAIACWGDDFWGQLGDGEMVAPAGSISGPLGLVDTTQLCAGGLGSCAIDASSSLWCWGIAVDSKAVEPIQVMAAVSYSSTTGAHVCGMLQDGSVVCAGRNDAGQLGDGTTDFHASAVAVVGVSDARQLATGGGFSCALRADDTVWCWGANTHGELGRGSTTAKELTAAPVAGLSGAVDVGAGASHACAVLSDGMVVCWGYNFSHQVSGTATKDDEALAVVVPGVPPAAAVAAGGRHTCALTIDGRVFCWGANDDGQVGDGQPSLWAPPSEVHWADL